eukprot:Rhum_TRINITY_DN13283_c0_g1::Rhum_TRINITY_DN13283_c0_g1_i3::g.58707::m.58707
MENLVLLGVVVDSQGGPLDLGERHGPLHRLLLGQAHVALGDAQLVHVDDGVGHTRVELQEPRHGDALLPALHCSPQDGCHVEESPVRLTEVATEVLNHEGVLGVELAAVRRVLDDDDTLHVASEQRQVLRVRRAAEPLRAAEHHVVEERALRVDLLHHRPPRLLRRRRPQHHLHQPLQQPAHVLQVVPLDRRRRTRPPVADQRLVQVEHHRHLAPVLRRLRRQEQARVVHLVNGRRRNRRQRRCTERRRVSLGRGRRRLRRLGRRGVSGRRLGRRQAARGPAPHHVLRRARLRAAGGARREEGGRGGRAGGCAALRERGLRFVVAEAGVRVRVGLGDSTVVPVVQHVLVEGAQRDAVAAARAGGAGRRVVHRHHDVVHVAHFVCVCVCVCC